MQAPGAPYSPHWQLSLHVLVRVAVPHLPHGSSSGSLSPTVHSHGSPVPFVPPVVLEVLAPPTPPTPPTPPVPVLSLTSPASPPSLTPAAPAAPPEFGDIPASPPSL